MANVKTADYDFFEKIGYVFGLIGKSWDAFKLNWTTFVLIWLMPMLLMILLVPLFIIPAVSDSGAITFSAILLALLGTLAVIGVILVLVPAMILTQIESVKGNKIGFEAAFKQSKKFVWNFVLAAIISFFIIVGPMMISFLLMIVIIGFFLFPLALIWAMIAPFFLLLVPYLIVTNKLAATEAISASYDLTKKYWQWVLAVYIVLLAISVANSLLNIVPLIGWIIGIGLSLAYFCMPAYIFVTEISSSKVNLPSEEPEETPKPAKVTRKPKAKSKK